MEIYTDEEKLLTNMKDADIDDDDLPEVVDASELSNYIL